MNRVSLICCVAMACMLLTGCARQTHENLHATLWVQTSGEYDAICRQTFAQAKAQLQAALSDPNWTASLEQLEAGNYQSKRPAIIFDVDETLLDNSPYQAQLVRDNKQYTSASWRAWVDVEAAQPLPGAVELVRWAKSRGVDIVYVTNRKADEEPATRRNLKAAGFPVDGHADAVLTKGKDGEQTWESNKTARRAWVAKKHRILLLVGDDMNDFVDGTKVGDPAVRQQMSERYADMWGGKWIVLPNPAYGSWEAALLELDYTQSDAVKLRKKYDHLRGYKSN